MSATVFSYDFDKVKLDGTDEEAPTGSSGDLQVRNEDGGDKTSTPSDLWGHADPNLNAVKIEKLSDDEDVDITDEADQLPSQASQPNSSIDLLVNIPNNKTHDTNEGKEFTTFDDQEDLISKSSEEHLQNIRQDKMETFSSSRMTFCTETQNITGEKSVELIDHKYNKVVKTCTEHDGNGIVDDTGHMNSPEPSEIQKDLSDSETSFPSSSYPVEEESHEEEELKPPEQEVEVDRNSIQEEEKQAIPEFFEGRQAKTPERYLRIRNYILDQW